MSFRNLFGCCSCSLRYVILLITERNCLPAISSYVQPRDGQGFIAVSSSSRKYKEMDNQISRSTRDHFARVNYHRSSNSCSSGMEISSENCNCTSIAHLLSGPFSACCDCLPRDLFQCRHSLRGSFNFPRLYLLIGGSFAGLAQREIGKHFLINLP